MTRRILRTATIAIAVAALAAPTALARLADMPPAVAKAAAAEQHKQARLAQVNPYPTRPAQGEQANPRPEPTMTAAPSAPAERDIAWTTIAVGIAAGLLTLGAIGGIPLGRLGEPEEVARVVRFLSSDNAGYITGQVWGVNGGLDM